MENQSIEKLKKENVALETKLDISAAKLAVLNPLLSQLKSEVSAQEYEHSQTLERYKEVRAILRYADGDVTAQKGD